MPADRHLLVDAYNVIHAWPELRKVLTAHGPAAAQARLAEWVRPIHDAEGWRVTLVFDGRGDDITIERPGKEPTFSFAFSPRGLTADGVIQQLVANATLPPEQDPHVPEGAPKAQGGKARPSARATAPRRVAAEIVVASRDHLLGESAAANGARVMSPELLREWCEHAAARETRTLAAQARRSDQSWRAGSSPWDQLPPLPR